MDGLMYVQPITEDEYVPEALLQSSLGYGVWAVP